MSQLLADPPVRSMPKRSRARVFRLRHFLVTALIVAILITTVVFRIWRLDSVPGINGDEAWSGVQALRFLHGEPIAWRTPTGNPINVFFFVPLVLLHMVAKPSIALLRIVPLVSGVLALLVNYLFCKRVFDRTTAVISTLLLACLPINIAYSRFAWDASQSLLATLPVVYLSLLVAQKPEQFARYISLAVLALFAAVVVHPTNVFVAPLLVVATLSGKWNKVRTLAERCRHESKLQTLLVGISMVAIGAGWLWRARLTPAVERLLSLPDMALECKLYLRLLSGSTIYRFISGSIDNSPGQTSGLLNDCDIYDLVAFLVVVIAVWSFMCRLRVERDVRDRVLGLGTLAIVAGFYLVAGPKALAPHFERYSICLIAPTTLVFSRGFCVWGKPSTKLPSQWLVTTGALLICVGMLVSFYVNYFHAFTVSGGKSHPAFRTGKIDPKQNAVEYILAHRKSNETTWIACDSWWSFWPVAYLAYGQQNMHVVDQNDHIGISRESAQVVWDLRFSGTDNKSSYPDDLAPFSEYHTFNDPTGAPVITIFRRETKKFPE